MADQIHGVAGGHVTAKSAAHQEMSRGKAPVGGSFSGSAAGVQRTGTGGKAINAPELVFNLSNAAEPRFGSSLVQK